MRWIGQTETALEMLVKRAEERQLHGAPLAEKQAIQWMIADSAMELYSAKLMVLHAAYKIENEQPFRQEVSALPSITSRTCSGRSSTARSRYTARSATPPTRRWSG